MKPAACALAVLMFLSFRPDAQAADHEVGMLNYGTQGGMVFEPGFLKAEVGDTVTFVPASSGHNSRSYVVPEGAEQWNSPIDQKYTVTLSRPGVYIYYCPPHLMMGMLGVIQAGEPANAQIALEKAAKLRRKLLSGKERLDRSLAEVK